MIRNNFFLLLIFFFAEEVVNVIVEGGAIPALVKHLQAPLSDEGDLNLKPFEHEVEKGSAFALGLLAVKVILLNIYIFTKVGHYLYSLVFIVVKDLKF